MRQVKNADFFKQKSSFDSKPETSEQKQDISRKPVVHRTLAVSNEVAAAVKKTDEVFRSFGMTSGNRQIAEIRNQLTRNRFTVAVVGEFSKGKSTFINKFIGKDFLPVADLPSTALLTRIRYNPSELLVLLDKNGNKVKSVPLRKDAWDGITADNFGCNEPDGTVYVGINNHWLDENNVEIIDTPGAGDLEEKRARVIGDALLGCDAAIITISATAALSLSEKLFIEQRILTRKTPFVMLIVTKLDEVPLEERSQIVDYIIKKLRSWGTDIPVFIPYDDVELPDTRYESVRGLDKIRAVIEQWTDNPERKQLTEDWIMTRLKEIIESEIQTLNEQLAILRVADEKERNELIEDKKRLLSKAHIKWEELRLQMLEKSGQCEQRFCNKIDSFKIAIVEKLQYECSHSNNLQRWWDEDYPYRLKMELTNMSVGLENVISRIIAEDVKWFNSVLDAHFKSHILYDSVHISDSVEFDSGRIKDVTLEDIGKKRNIVRIGTTALSLALYPICLSSGCLPLIATMGVSTGTSIISEKIFAGKIEQQRQTIKSAISENVPRIIDEAVGESRKSLAAVYSDIYNSAVEKEKEWMNSQRSVIENSVRSQNELQINKLQDAVNTLLALI